MVTFPEIKRWTFPRKWAVLRAINTGELTPALAHSIYGIGAEELASWRTRVAQGGLKALRQNETPLIRKEIRN